MSKIALTGNASGTGTLTIAAPNTNSDRTLNLPDGAGTVILEPSSGELVINDGSADVDFRVESDGNANMLFVDAGNNNVYIGKSASNTSAVGNEFLSYGRHITTVDNTTCSIINRTSSDGTILLFEKDGSAQGNIGCEGGKLKLTSSGSNLVFAVGTTTYINMDNLRLYPQTDDSYDLGIVSHRFDDIFATNGTIQTSDQNEKQDIASATEKELTVSKKLSALFKTFRWKDKVTEKGDKARIHSGIIAQDIQSAFSSEGLDASNYGLFTSDTWWEKEISVAAVKEDKEKGIPAKDAYTYMDTKYEKADGYTERTRLGVRYPELFSFIFSSIEARIAALEAK